MRVELDKIKPIGAVLILVLSAVGIYMSFTADLGVPERYVSLHDTAYYTQNAETMGELLSELRENVFPRLEGITDSYVASDAALIVISVDKENYDKVCAVLQRDFDESLFEFVKAS